MCDEATTPAGGPAPEPDATYLRFRDAAERDFARTRRVEDCAEALGYSARTLAAAGRGAKEFIDRRVVLKPSVSWPTKITRARSRSRSVTRSAGTARVESRERPYRCAVVQLCPQRIVGALSVIDLTPRQFSVFSPGPHRRGGNSEAPAQDKGP